MAPGLGVVAASVCRGVVSVADFFLALTARALSNRAVMGFDEAGEEPMNFLEPSFCPDAFASAPPSAALSAASRVRFFLLIAAATPAMPWITITSTKISSPMM